MTPPAGDYRAPQPRQDPGSPTAREDADRACEGCDSTEGVSAGDVVREYFRAWTSGDVERALALMVDDVTVTAPNGEYHGEEGYRDFLEGFLRLLDSVEDSTVLVEDGTAVVWYRYTTHLPGLGPQVAAERITLRGGRVAAIEYLFDQTPFAQALGSGDGRALHEAVNSR